MHFGLSPEQRELATTVRSLLERRADPQAVRAATESEQGYDPTLWQTLCEQIGAAALSIDEVYDGAGFSLFETGILLAELGRSLAPTPLLASVVAAEALLAAGDGDAGTRLLPRIAEGAIATLAWPGVTAADVAAPADVVAAGNRLTGTVENVLFGAQAAILLVAATDEDGGSALFEVDPASVEVVATPAMDTTLQLARVRLDGAEGVRIGGDADPALRRAGLAGSVGVGCLQLGCAERGLEMTVDYSKERVQFGRPIGSFQALKHRMADMLVLVETTRSMVWAATHALASEDPGSPHLVASAASYAGDALRQVAGETVQLHGGIAITWEHDASLLFKRAHALNQLFGLPHQHRAQIAL